jgi:hypothetical protein
MCAPSTGPDGRNRAGFSLGAGSPASWVRRNSKSAPRASRGPSWPFCDPQRRSLRRRASDHRSARREAAGRHRLHRRCAARKLRARRCCPCVFSISSEWRIRRLCHQILDAGGARCGLRAAALHRRDRSKGKGVRHATARPRERPDLTRLLPNLPIALGKRGPMSVAKMFLFVIAKMFLFVSRQDGL